MRILIVHAEHRELGGEDVVADSEAALLAAAGHDIERFSAQNPSGAGAIPSFGAAPWNVRQSRRLHSTIERFAPDVVHIHNTWFALSPSVVRTAAASSAATVMTLHNYRLMCADATLLRDEHICHDCVGSSPLPAIRHRCYRGSLAQSLVAAAAITIGRAARAYDGVDRFIAPTDLVRQTHIDSGLIGAARIVTAPHFVDDPGTRTQSPSEGRYFMWAGRIAAGKGLESLLEAWRRASLADVELHVYGDGPSRVELEARAPTSVRFFGFRPRSEIQAALRGARAFVFVSEWLEPFGLVLIEAIASGTPVLGFATGDTQQIVGRGALLVPTGDIDGLARQLQTTSSETLDALGPLARAQYLEHFTPAAHRLALEAVYKAARLDTKRVTR
jgi:glycosyltransferase involved in cell wall biosynthesis